MRPLRTIYAVALSVITCVSPALAADAPRPPAEISSRARVAPKAVSRAAKPAHVEAVGDTVFVGYTPGQITSTNYWSLRAGSGAGFNRPPAEGGMWGWNSSPHGDSLQGWWPIREVYTTTSASLLPNQRPWTAIDFGNNANYVLNTGSASRRTFGVTGVWHVDAGANAGAANGATWTPLGGSSSAWMGLRRHGDTQYVDPITGNPYNADVLQFNGANPTSPTGNDKGFPGYGSQMDQMLYRDVDLTGAGGTVTISFKYRTALSTGRTTASGTSVGWFDKDPLAVAAGNFIGFSNTDVPTDSFMVYVGMPADNTFLASDGTTRPINDPQRRWFSEVLQSVAGHYFELQSTAGTVGTTTASYTLSHAQVLSILGSGNRVRLVFRVKTNRGFDDENLSYTSGGVGAAIVDDVSINTGAGPVTIGAFETASTINNSTGVTALSAWKSTSKPPAIYPHVSPLNTLTWDDVHGPPGSPGVLCDMSGNVVVNGNADDNNNAGDSRWLSDREDASAIVSPTIQLAGPYDQPGGKNAIGLTAANLAVTDDYYVSFDIYNGLQDPSTYGNEYRVGVQYYPVNDKNGRQAWSQITYPSFEEYDPVQECTHELFGAGSSSASASTSRLAATRTMGCTSTTCVWHSRTCRRHQTPAPAWRTHGRCPRATGLRRAISTPWLGTPSEESSCCLVAVTPPPRCSATPGSGMVARGLTPILERIRPPAPSMR